MLLSTTKKVNYETVYLLFVSLFISVFVFVWLILKGDRITRKAGINNLDSYLYLDDTARPGATEHCCNTLLLGS